MREAERWRIEHGVARWGSRIDPEIIPVEANLEADAIDYGKGCYIGQEVISRMKISGQTNKRLCGLISLAGTPLSPGNASLSTRRRKGSGQDHERDAERSVRQRNRARLCEARIQMKSALACPREVRLMRQRSRWKIVRVALRVTGVANRKWIDPCGASHSFGAPLHGQGFRPKRLQDLSRRQRRRM